MQSQWQTDQKEGYKTMTVQIGNCTVTVHRPILNDQEKAKREEKVRDALKGLKRKGT